MELEDILHMKWRQAMHSAMLRATELQDFETNNFHYTAENKNATLCIWANLSRNSRLKTFLTFNRSSSRSSLELKVINSINMALVLIYPNHYD